MRRRATRRSALLIVFAMIGGLLAATMGTASAGTPTVVVSPNSNLVTGQVVNVSITSDVTAAHFYAVTQCGNADSAGNPIAPGNAADCAGQAQLGSQLRLVSSGGLDLGALAGGIVAGDTYVAPLTLQKSGIGANGAQCLPVGGAITNPCIVTVAETDATQVIYGQVATPITYRLPATVAISSVTGQNAGVTTAARATNVIAISGGNWDASGTLTASLCDVTLTTCDAAGALTGSGSTSGAGAASGNFTVNAGATVGARALRVTDGVQTASVAVQILGTRSVTLAPAAGGVGTAVAVNGASFDASQAVTIVGLDAAFAPVAALPVSGTSSAVGAVNASYTIADPDTAYIAISEDDNPTTEASFSPFSFSANSCNGTGCEVLQTVTLVVNPGVLNITQADNFVTMTPITLNGEQQASTGNLQDITITDARGSLVGWSVTATMTNLNELGGGSNSTIVNSNMTLSPTCGVATATSGSITGITAGAATQSLGGVVTLCTAAVGQGGGTYAVDGGLNLTIPANIRSGTYTSTITILLT